MDSTSAPSLLSPQPPQRPWTPAYAPPTAGTDLPIASLGRRGVAVLIDTFVLIALAFLTAIPVVLIALGISYAIGGGDLYATFVLDSSSQPGDLLTLAFAWPLAGLGPLLYSALLTRKSGQTLGKRALGIRIVMADGSPIISTAAWNRSMATIAPFMLAAFVGPILDAVLGTPPACTFGVFGLAQLYYVANVFFAPAFGDRRRALHDRIAGTVVVDAAPAPAPGAVIVPRPRRAATYLLPLAGLAELFVPALMVVGAVMLASGHGASRRSR